MEDKQTQIDNEVQKFFTLQEERSLTYTVFNEAHKIYLASTEEKAFFKFKSVVDDVTNEFKRISSSIIEIERKLSEKFNEQILSSIIRDIQSYEKTKLTLTAQLQIKKKEQKDNPTDEIDDSITALNRKLRDTINNINDLIETMKYEIDS